MTAAVPHEYARETSQGRAFSCLSFRSVSRAQLCKLLVEARRKAHPATDRPHNRRSSLGPWGIPMRRTPNPSDRTHEIQTRRPGAGVFGTALEHTGPPEVLASRGFTNESDARSASFNRSSWPAITVANTQTSPTAPGSRDQRNKRAPHATASPSTAWASLVFAGCVEGQADQSPVIASRGEIPVRSNEVRFDRFHPTRHDGSTGSTAAPAFFLRGGEWRTARSCRLPS